MIEWRDADDWIGSGRQEVYAELSNAEIKQLSSQLDTVFKTYIKGAIEGGHDYVGYGDGSTSECLTYAYSETSINALGEPIITDTVFDLEYMTFPTGWAVDRLTVNVARQISTNHDLGVVTVDGTERELSRYAHAPFIEHYVLLKLRGGERQAYIDQLDLTTERGEMRERVMTRYDQAQLQKEIGAINNLYELVRQERANIEK